MILATSLFVLLVRWSIDVTDPSVQEFMYYTFYIVHTVLFVMVFYLFYRILLSSDTRMVRTKDQYTGEMRQMTAKDYDFSIWRQLFYLRILPMFLTSLFVALRFKTLIPLLLQSVMQPVNFYQNPLFQLYVLCRPEEGKLLRPWDEDFIAPKWLKEMWERYMVS